VVPISNEYAAFLISQYLDVDHPTLGFFDADLFVQDLVHRRLEFCSPLLVSSLLHWAVVSLPPFPNSLVVYDVDTRSVSSSRTGSSIQRPLLCQLHSSPKRRCFGMQSGNQIRRQPLLPFSFSVLARHATAMTKNVYFSIMKQNECADDSDVSPKHSLV